MVVAPAAIAASTICTGNQFGCGTRPSPNTRHPRQRFAGLLTVASRMISSTSASLLSIDAQMDLRRGKEDVDTAPPCMTRSLRRRRAMSSGTAAGQTCRSPRFWRSSRSPRPIRSRRRSDREAGFDDIDSHVVEHVGDFESSPRKSWGAGALLAVAQGGVKNNDAVLVGLVRGSHGNDPLVSAPCGALEGLAFLRSPECPGDTASQALRGR